MIVTRGFGLSNYIGAIVTFGFALVGLNRPFNHGVLPPGGIIFCQPDTPSFIKVDGLVIQK